MHEDAANACAGALTLCADRGGEPTVSAIGVQSRLSPRRHERFYLDRQQHSQRRLRFFATRQITNIFDAAASCTARRHLLQHGHKAERKMIVNSIDKAVQAVKELVAALPQTERREFAGKISGIFAAGELTSVDDAPAITSLAASTAEAARTRLSPIQAANAGGGNAAHLVRNVMSRARRLGYVMKESALVDIDEMNSHFSKSKDIDERMAIKAAMARLRMI